MRFSREIQKSIEETGADPQADIAAIRKGQVTRDQLLAYCLDGVETDDGERTRAWNEYVEIICDEAEKS